MPKIEKSLAQFISEAITKDYLITLAITSYTQAKYQTANLPFGLGKTTLGMEINYLLSGGSVNDNYSRMDVWDKVKKTMVYDPYHMGELLEPGSERKSCVIWDDPQATAPAAQSVPKPIRQLANFISTERPEVALIILTTPNLNYISAPLRKLVNFEIIVSERGLYEVHKISYYKNFRKPLQDNMHFDYVEEIPRDQPFPPLPKEIKEWYDQWRIGQKMQLYPGMMKNLKVYTQLRQWEENQDVAAIPQLQVRVVKGPHGFILACDNQEALASLHGKNLNAVLGTTG
jgi:hypothetical protein